MIVGRWGRGLVCRLLVLCLLLYKCCGMFAAVIFVASAGMVASAYVSAPVYNAIGSMAANGILRLALKGSSNRSISGF